MTPFPQDFIENIALVTVAWLTVNNYEQNKSFIRRG